MELKLSIGYAELLELVRQLPLKELIQLQADLQAELMSKEQGLPDRNIDAILSLAGSLEDNEASAIKTLIDKEFETIEGEW